MRYISRWYSSEYGIRFDYIGSSCLFGMLEIEMMMHLLSHSYRYSTISTLLIRYPRNTNFGRGLQEPLL